MYLLEEELEQIVYRTPKEELRKRGLGIPGRLDIIAIDKIADGHYYITIYELKRGEINQESFWQLIGYIRGVQRWFSHNRPDAHCEIYFALIGASVCTKSKVTFLPYIFENLTIYTYNFDYSGIHFKMLPPHFNTEESFKSKKINNG
jgi:hypothetical protein